jgi:hypothetical protein
MLLSNWETARKQVDYLLLLQAIWLESRRLVLEFFRRARVLMMAQCGVGDTETMAALGMEMAHTGQARK